MNLQISSRLAIFALLELAVQPDRQVSVAEIGEKYGISSHHLAKVMRALSRAGLVRSARGAGGGYQFSGNARRTTLFDVIRLFETMGAANARAGAAERTAAARALRELLGEIDDIARATLGSVTLATMLKLVERQRTLGRENAGRRSLPTERGP
jgi:Rrf2 family transcriptional regulator, nitric oxide-sensitive transcriptional repressor